MRQVWLAVAPDVCPACYGPQHFELCVEHAGTLLRQCNCGLQEVGCENCGLAKALRKKER